MTRDLTLLLPEIGVALAALLGLVITPTRDTPRLAERVVWIAAALSLVFALIVAARLPASGALLATVYVDDTFARLIKVLLLMAAGALSLIALRPLEALGLMRSEVPILLGLAALGGMIIASSADLLLTALGLEILTAALFALSRLRLGTRGPAPVGPAYRDSILATGLIALGIAMILANGASTAYAPLSDALAAALSPDTPTPPTGQTLALLFGVGAVVTGVIAKFSVAPLRLWQPETGRDMAVPMVAMLDLLPKIALVALLGRLLPEALGPLSPLWQPILATIALLAVILGGLAALMQSDLKGALAHSGLAQVGLMLIGLAAGGSAGLLAALLALVLFCALQAGGYAFAAGLMSEGRPFTALTALEGFAARAPARSFAMLLILLGLSGAPPLIGYTSKVALVFAAEAGGWLWLALLAGLAFLACVAVYLRLAIALFTGEEDDILDSRFDGLPVVFVMLAAGVSVVGAFTIFGLEDLAWAAAESLAR